MNLNDINTSLSILVTEVAAELVKHCSNEGRTFFHACTTALVMENLAVGIYFSVIKLCHYFSLEACHRS